MHRAHGVGGRILLRLTSQRVVVAAGSVLATLVAIGCGDGPGAAEARPERATAAKLVDGDGQTAEAEARLPSAITIRVVGASGNPARAAVVRTSVSGGGVVTPENAATGADGLASFAWTLGSLRGTQTLTIQVDERGVGAVTVSATATRPTVTRLTLTGPAAVAVGSITEITATAVDARGKVVSDAPVSWLSSNRAAATVVGTGATVTVVGIALGTTTLTAAADDIVATQTLTIRPAPSPFVQVSAGASHTCARTAEGSVYCWGWNDAGQLGDGTQVHHFTPTPVGGDVRFARISAGAFSTCGVDPVGAAYCWGANWAGQLGDGSKSGSSIPVAVAGSLKFADVSAGPDADCEQAGCGHTCARTLAGVAYCWGDNGPGSLGDGTRTERLVPTPVTGGLSFAAITSGGGHTCGLSSQGAASCWGYNFSGQLGTRQSDTFVLVPTAVDADVSFAEVRPGLYHTCARTTLGRIYCWGFNGSGELGTGTSSPMLPPWASAPPAPVVGDLVFSALAVGYSHGCGLTTDGAAYCWGYNGAGQLGDGTLTQRLVPTRVSGNLVFTEITAGGFHTCARTSDGVIYCWGMDGTAVQPDGTGTVHLAPTRVQ